MGKAGIAQLVQNVACMRDNWCRIRIAEDCETGRSKEEFVGKENESTTKVFLHRSSLQHDQKDPSRLVNEYSVFGLRDQNRRQCEEVLS